MVFSTVCATNSSTELAKLTEEVLSRLVSLAPFVEPTQLRRLSKLEIDDLNKKLSKIQKEIDTNNSIIEKTDEKIQNAQEKIIEYEMSINIKGKVLNGKIPKKHKKLVDAWIALHTEELKAAWYALNNDGEVIKIKGLE